jgi:hypothetical protein
VALGIVYHNDGKVERVTSNFVLWKVIGIPPSQQTAEHGKRLGYAMRHAGNNWVGSKQMWIGGRNVKGFERELANAPKPGRQPRVLNDNFDQDFEP